MRNGGRTDTGAGLTDCTISRLPPAFLISQKSKIFDSFPPGEAFAPGEAFGRAIDEELWYACHRQALRSEDSLRSAARPYGGDGGAVGNAFMRSTEGLNPFPTGEPLRRLGRHLPCQGRLWVRHTERMNPFPTGKPLRRLRGEALGLEEKW